MLPNNRILILLRNEDVLRYFRDVLFGEGGYSVVTESDAHAGFSLIKQEAFDLVIAGVDLPGFEGFAAVHELKAIDPSCVVLVYADELRYDFMEQAQSLGVYDFITKPFNPEKLFFLVRKGIERRILLVSHRRLVGILKEQNSSLQRQNILLARRIEESAKNLSRLYEDLRLIYLRTIRVLAQAIDARDHYTHDHSENVAKYSVAIGHRMGLSIKEIEMIRDAAELHDLGKIGIEDAVLMKPSALSSDEWQLVKLHPQMGAQILEPLTFLSDVVEIVRQHHEHYDGTGYPAGRRAEEILVGARIIHLADAFDAMTSARSYRKTPLSRDQAVNEIRKHTNTQFDPKVVEAFLQIVHEL